MKTRIVEMENNTETKEINCCWECPFLRETTSYEQYVCNIVGRICDKGNFTVNNFSVVCEKCPLPKKV